MVEETKSNNSICLTEEEAAVYDRQIRLWGVEAQQRLRKSKILLVGLSGLGNEVCKNILLAGIQHMTLLDDSILTEEDCFNQFLTPSDMVGKNKAEACLSCAKDLNPMVDIVTDNENIGDKSEEFIKRFDVVCLTGCNRDTQVKVNEICHRLGIKFLAGNVFGYYGYMFADLGVHSYIEEIPKKVKNMKDGEGSTSAKKSKTEQPDTEVIEKVSSFCTLSEALSVPVFKGKSLRQAKQVSETYLVTKVLLEYQQRYGLIPNEINSQQELEKLLDVRNEVLEEQNVDNDLLDDEFCSYCVGTLYPVNAIIGGVMAQEVIKAVSGKDTPHNNFFFYDGVSTSGIVQKISPIIDKMKPLVAEEKPSIVTADVIL